MRFNIQEFDVFIELMTVRWVFAGIIEAPYKMAATRTLNKMKRLLADENPINKVDVYNEPDWDNVDYNEFISDKKSLWNDKEYPFAKGYWVAVWMRSYTGLKEKNYDFTAYNCVVFLKDFTMDALEEQLKKINWKDVCWAGDNT